MIKEMQSRIEYFRHSLSSVEVDDYQVCMQDSIVDDPQSIVAYYFE